MISIKAKPRHLSARLIRLRPDYPSTGFYLETLELTAELEDRNVDFTISLILCEKAESANTVTVGEPKESPDKNTVYIIGDIDEIICCIGRQIQVKRRSNKSDSAILDWLVIRVKEYANSRYL